MKKKRLWLVRREVWAFDIEDAIAGTGEVYGAELADEKFQPDSERKVKGFEG